MTTERLTVYCDEAFHDQPSVEVRVFTRMDGEWFIADPNDDLILDDQPYFASGRPLADAEGTRERRRLECACGASLVMRADKLEALLSRLADGEVNKISLSRLNLLVSIPR